MFLTKRHARRIRKLILATALSIALVFLNTKYFLSDEVLQYKASVYIPVESPEGLEAYKNLWVGFPELNWVQCTPLLKKSLPNNFHPVSLPRIGSRKLVQDSQNCSSFLQNYGFNRYTPVTKEEEDFPLAYIILFHKDLHQVLYFLRAIYRRHNVYCLNVDLDSGPAFINAVRDVTKCLHNVFLAGKLESIVYAGYSRFQADINCMEELIKHPVQWKYLHNMPGQQFPLRTNLEIVKIMAIYGGNNDVEGVSNARSHPRRFKIKHHLIYNNSTGKKVIVESAGRKPPPPHSFKMVKGSTYGSLSRAFVEYVLYNKDVNDLMEWSKDVESPDEYIFPTLHFSLTMDVPGGYRGVPGKKKFLASFAAWEKQYPCASMYVRWICILTPGDLPMLMERHNLFANKFYIDHYPAALHCLDQYLYNMTVAGIVRDLGFYRQQKLM